MSTSSGNDHPPSRPHRFELVHPVEVLPHRPAGERAGGPPRRPDARRRARPDDTGDRSGRDR